MQEQGRGYCNIYNSSSSGEVDNTFKPAFGKEQIIEMARFALLRFKMALLFAVGEDFPVDPQVEDVQPTHPVKRSPHTPRQQRCTDHLPNNSA